MARNLADSVFTNRADEAQSSSGWLVSAGQTVNTREGSDEITASGAMDALTVSGVLNLGGGSDEIVATGTSRGIVNDGRIFTGGGDDEVTGIGPDQGIFNTGVINTGKGEDEVEARGGFGGSGTINLGQGDDDLIGFGSGRFIGGSGDDEISFGQGVYVINAEAGTIVSNGITMRVSQFEEVGGIQSGEFDFASGTLTVNANGIATFVADSSVLQPGPRDLLSVSFTNRADEAQSNSGWLVSAGQTVNTREGSDEITASGAMDALTVSGVLNLGGGSDEIVATGTSRGIVNDGRIFTGGGDDEVTGIGPDQGIFNTGVINTGKGEDEVEARGGFGGSGTINLGQGDDDLIGFGSGRFIGGSGDDEISFGQGVYVINAEAGTIVSNGITMRVSQFEEVGGIQSGEFDFASGTLTVNANGIATFVADSSVLQPGPRDLLSVSFTNRADEAQSNSGWLVSAGQTVNTREGSDEITASGAMDALTVSGVLNLGGGSDEIVATGTSRGIVNDGRIFTGGGDDEVTGIGPDQGIFNTGVINTGKGEDEVEARGGFGGSGTINLGQGDDDLIGFGSGRFIGGSGDDEISFGQGVYVINAEAGTIVSNGITMRVSQFEEVGGIQSGEFDFASGTLTVNANGVGSFDSLI
ncbi:hypothetical protein EVJ50_07065 [Synechococcus sp. RSCCF101]|nr:hypothetical protein EVJ50_07065 [Synechococcus sp. RSCCF101]